MSDASDKEFIANIIMDSACIRFDIAEGIAEELWDAGLRMVEQRVGARV